MLDLARSLHNETNDPVISAVKIEGELLDTRLLNQETTDEEALRTTKQRLAEDRDRLADILRNELSSLRSVSAKRVANLRERDPIQIHSQTHSKVLSSDGVDPQSMPAAEKVVDFWRGKQSASQAELKSIEAQLASIKSKIEDVKTASNGKDQNGPAKLMCSIGALRQKLQQARMRTKDYQRLLSGVEDMSLPQSQHATGALAAIAAQPREVERESDYDQEALSLCLVESSLVNELDCARNLAQYSQFRKQNLESKISFFATCLEEGQLTLANPPEQPEWPALKIYEPAVTDEAYDQIIGQEAALEAERVSSIRERHVSMMREMNDTTMNRWIEKQRLSRLSEHTEKHVNEGLREKAAILYRLDEIATQAKVNTSLLAASQRKPLGQR